MKKILATLVALVLLSSVSFAETQQSSNPTTPDIDEKGIDIGPIDVTMEPTSKEKHQYDIGIKRYANNVVWIFKVNKTLDNFKDTNQVSAGIGWKF
jgi:opacity protein-like surface antigen